MAKRILILFLLAGVLIGPEDLSSCGPFLPVTLFTSHLAPLDEPRFFAGQLDVLQPHYRRLYLMVAYRYLAGIGLNREDQQALLVQPATSDVWTSQGSPAVEGWLRARVEVGAPPLARIDQFKMVPDHVFILNCGDDAFRSAAATLIERGRSGNSHDDLRAWVAAQDQVFANCSNLPNWPPRPQAPSIPASLPATAAPWMQADRAYQIAAAEFYVGQLDEAAADFRRIAGDRSSPWHGIAPYLVARALIRKATIVDPAAAPAAQEQLRQVLADPDAAAWHESARGLSRYLRARTEPAGALREVAHIVGTQKSGVANAVNDCRFILDQYSNRDQDPPRDEDIVDWLAEMQYSPDDHALKQWRTKRSLPWLVAALTYADQPDPELMAAAAQVPDSSSAFLTVEFHRLRLMPADEARPRLDAMLRRKMSASARNQFLAERMRLSRDWDELLRYAPRTATGTFVEGGGEEATTGHALYFDEDAARILDRQAPLAILVEAARSKSLPPNLQLEVARAVWVRSILLNHTDTAKGIAPILAALAPYLKPYLDGYLAAPDEKARAFAAAWLMLHNPGMRPSIDSGAGRPTATPKLDIFRDNWWCPEGDAPNNGRGFFPDARLNAPLELLYQDKAPEAAFAGRKPKGPTAVPAAPAFMARQAVEWVEAHPDDPRAPESLRLAVRAGHYACGGDGQSDHWTKRAFQLLHARYSKTEAARQTPYWFSAGSH